MEPTNDNNNVRLRGGSIEGVFSPRRVGKDSWRKPSIEKPLYGKIPKHFAQPAAIPKGGAYVERPLHNNTKKRIILLALQESRFMPNISQPLYKKWWAVRERVRDLSRTPREYELAAIFADDRKLGTEKWIPTRTLPTLRLPRPDEFESTYYTDLHTNLFMDTKTFCKEYFEYQDFNPTAVYGEPPVAGEDPVVAQPLAGSSPWQKAKFSEQFIHYASLVATQDANCGGWDVLLTSKAHRLYMVTGLIGRVMQNAIFDDLLFGATETQRKLLDACDENTPDFDGFETTKIRADLVRSFLKETKDELVTEHFWDCVDKVTLQLARIVIPLLDLMDAEFPNESKPKDIRNFYQGLHDLVSQAAWLSLQIRWSRDIFRFDWPTLGLAWAIEQENYDNEFFAKSYNESHQLRNRAIARAAAQRAEEEARTSAGTATEGRWASVAAPVSTFIQKANKYIFGDPNVLDFDKPLSKEVVENAWTSPDFLNKVQIILWPALYRHCLGRPDNKKASGVTITAVDKSLNVYCCGRVDQIGQWVESNGDRLTEWVEKKRLETEFRPIQFLRSLFRWWRFFFVLALILNVASLVAFGIISMTGWTLAADIYGVLKEFNKMIAIWIYDRFLWCIVSTLWILNRVLAFSIWLVNVVLYLFACFWSFFAGTEMSEEQLIFGRKISPTLTESVMSVWQTLADWARDPVISVKEWVLDRS